MAEFNSVVTTESGLKLIALSAGMTKPLTFTKVVIGSGHPAEGDDVTKYTAVKTPKLTCSVSKICPVTDETDAARWSVYAAFANDAVDEGFYMEEIGLYAKVTATDYSGSDWDGYAGEEVLFGYAYAVQDKADWLPDKSTPLDVMEWIFYATVGNASSVTAIIPPETYALAEDLTAHITDPDAHADIFAKYAKVTDLDAHKKDPDAHADIVAEIMEKIKATYYPHIGDIIITKDTENPVNRYPGTTWQLLGSDTFLMSTTAANVGTTGGANTHTITAAQMPSHTHSITCGSAGAHTHTRGSMNIKGTFSGAEASGNTATGAFYMIDGKYNGINDSDNDNQLFGFDASKNWTGSTSENGAHTHTITAAKTGNGQSYDSRPKYMGVCMWMRTA